MTVNYRPDDKDVTALLKSTMRVTLQDPAGHVFLVHIPIVDLPEELLDQLPPEDRGGQVRLMNRMVILCLN